MKYDFEIKRLGHLSLAYKTWSHIYPSKYYKPFESKETDLEISMWDSNFEYRWTIASFEMDYEDEEFNGYKLVSCGERLKNPDINWADFGELVKCGYAQIDKYLDEHLKDLYK